MYINLASTEKPPTTQKRALDLFLGTGSVGQRLQDWGYNVTSLDNNPNTGATITVDILKWNVQKLYPPGYFDLIAAGVPCQNYSVANTTGTRDLLTADKIVKKTLQIIEYLAPKYWWIENPRFGLLRKRPFMRNLPYIDVDYCQFSEMGYQKPTRIWCCEEIARPPSVKCDGISCPNVYKASNGQPRHRERLGGNLIKFSTKQKGQMPKAVTDYLISAFCADPHLLFSPI